MEVVLDPIGPDSVEAEAGGFKFLLACEVRGAFFGIEVDGAVDFDCEAEFVAVEVEDEAADCVLAAELQAQDAPVAERLPEGVFGRSLRASQAAGSRNVMDVLAPSWFHGPGV